ncbi:MAG TPA: tandem-95 repeat protein, partial [Candidatus Saccharimonadales bacterium]|nr:tandem-95 repeat protein [Candidatus Saccharimonadales bacterium]
QVLAEDSSSGALAFTVGDAETPAGSLTVSASSSNPSLLASGNFTFGGSGTSRTMTLNPAADQFGTALVTLTVNDGNGGTASTSFNVVVNPVNDSPSLDPIANIGISPGATRTVNLTGILAGPANESGQALAVSAVSSNPSLIPNPAVIYTSPAGTGSLLVTAQPYASSGSATITVTVNDGGAVNNLATRTFLVSLDGAPVISSIPDQNIDEDGSSGPLAFTVGDVETPAANLNVSVVSSSDTNLLPLTSIVLGGTASNRTVSVTTPSNASGSSVVTLSVADGGGNTVFGSFTVVVNPVNDLPTLDQIASVSIPEDNGPRIVNLTGISSGASDEAQPLTVSASSSNPALIPAPVVNYTSPNASGSLTLSPAANASGTATITVTVDDGGLSNNIVSRSFLVTVNPVNDAPTLNAIGDITLNEDGGLQTVNLTGITSGATDENQILVVTASSTAPGLIANPAVSYTSPSSIGTLNFSPAVNANGTATITVTVNDGGNSNNVVTRTFQVTVNAVNDAPTLNGIGDITLNEDGGLQTVNLTGITSGATDENQTLVVTASSSAPGLIANPAVSYTSPSSSGTLNFSPAPNANGTATITVTVNDGGASNNVVTRTFQVTVNAVNDAPTLAAISNLTLNANSPLQTVNLAGISSGATNETQVLTISASSSNPGLIPNPSVNYTSPAATGSLSITPVANQSGSAIISVIVQDNGGTANGGQNSVTNTFAVTVQVVAAPQLRIARAGTGRILVAWPTNYSGFVLQSCSTLGTGTWADWVTNPQIVGNEYVVTNAVSGAQYFRLAKGPNTGLPRLRVFTVAGNKVAVAWSTNNSGFVLQSRSTLGTGSWADWVTNPQIVGNEYVVTNTISGAQYFRLIKDPNAGLPRLRLFPVPGNKVALAWSTNALGYTLQSRNSLTSGTWTDLSITPAVIGNEFMATNSISGNLYFRLKK